MGGATREVGAVQKKKLVWDGGYNGQAIKIRRVRGDTLKQRGVSEKGVREQGSEGTAKGDLEGLLGWWGGDEGWSQDAGQRFVGGSGSRGTGVT